ncbi:MAG: S-layer homology domain-containing protein [Erysipelotrichaceae bacterium]|nr:S-layer homology domain-containing protein [Erysipelotrichaceae bacterium]
MIKRNNLLRTIAMIIVIMGMFLTQITVPEVRAEDAEVTETVAEEQPQAEENGDRATTEVYEGQPFRVTVTEETSQVFRFTPEETGTYYLMIGDVFASGTDWGEAGINFKFNTGVTGEMYVSSRWNDRELVGKLQAGTQYTFRIYGQNEDPTDFEMTINKRPFEIISVEAADVETYYGAEFGPYDLKYDAQSEEFEFDSRFGFSLSWFHITTDGFSGNLNEIAEYYGYKPDWVVTQQPESCDVGTYEVLFTIDEFDVSFNYIIHPSPISSVVFGDTNFYEGGIDYYTAELGGYYDENDVYIEPVEVILYSALPDSISVVADGKTYEGYFYEVQDQLYEKYGCWFSCFLMPRFSELSMGTTDVEWCFGGVRGNARVTLKPFPIVSIVGPADMNIYKDDFESYYWENEGIKIYTYFDSTKEITINTVDGAITGTWWDVESQVRDRYGLYLECSPEIDQHETPWKPGKTYKINISIGDVKYTYKAKIIDKNYIISATINDVTIEEGEITEGYEYTIDPSTGEMIIIAEHRYYYPYELTMKVKTIDGTFSGTSKEVYAELEKKMSNYYVDFPGIREEQDEYGAWETGSVHVAPYRLGTVEGTIKISIIPNTRPYITDFSQSTDGIEFNWSEVDNATKYVVYRRTYNGSGWENWDEDNFTSWKKIKTVSGTSLIDDVGKTMGKIYSYRVRALKSDGSYSNYSRNFYFLYNPFKDVEYGTPDFDHVAWAYNNGIVNGLSNDHTMFGVDGNCTRAQFCIMLWKMAGKPDTTGMTCPFTDLGGVNDNNKKAIIWCYNQGIVNGTGATKFSPSGSITRAQLAIMIWKLAGSPKIGSMTCPYTDLDGLTGNNKKAIIWCYNKGLINSISGTGFSPKTKGTRGLLVEMLYGYAHQ